MAAEDYQTERNGIQMNISKAVRIDKAKIKKNIYHHYSKQN
jgi:hypothetical protein